MIHWYSWQVLVTAFCVATFLTWLIWRPYLGLTEMENKFFKRHGQKLVRLSYVVVSVLSFVLGLAVGDIKHVYKNDTFQAGYDTKEKEQLKKNDTYAAGYQARELEQFKNTYDVHDLLVVHAFRNTAKFQKLDRDHGPLGQIFTLKFCDKPGMYWPKLVAGNIVEQIKYEERGDCESVSDKKLGVIIRRDKKNEAIVDRTLLAKAISFNMKGGE